MEFHADISMEAGSSSLVVGSRSSSSSSGSSSFHTTEVDDVVPSQIDDIVLFPSQALSFATPFEEAKNRIRTALKEFSENRKPMLRSPCLLLDRCRFDEISDLEMKTVHQLLLQLCSTIDQRRWSAKSGYGTKNIRSYRGACSRSGAQRHSLTHQNSRALSKCGCIASFTMKRDEKNDHSEQCLPDSYVGNDGYVFYSGLSPSKRSLIVTNLCDLLNDFRTTPAAAKRQIENSLVKSGDTGFGSGNTVLSFWFHFSGLVTLMIFRNYSCSLGQLCADLNQIVTVFTDKMEAVVIRIFLDKEEFET